MQKYYKRCVHFVALEHLSSIYCPPSGWIHWMQHNKQNCSHLGHLLHFRATPRFICGFYSAQDTDLRVASRPIWARKQTPKQEKV